MKFAGEQKLKKLKNPRTYLGGSTVSRCSDDDGSGEWRADVREPVLHTFTCPLDDETDCRKGSGRARYHGLAFAG